MAKYRYFCPTCDKAIYPIYALWFDDRSVKRVTTIYECSNCHKVTEIPKRILLEVCYG